MTKAFPQQGACMSAQHGAYVFPKRLVQGKGREQTRHKSKNKLPIMARVQWRELDFQVRAGEEEKVTEGNCETDRVKPKEG